MYLERLLQISIATMAALGTLLLGMGQRDPWLPLVMWIVAIISVWLTDFAGWLRLSRPVVNVLAVGAFFVFLWQASELRGLVQVLAIGYFLVYLQIIFLLQEKEPRTYAWLALLSLVQVVVAAVFYQKATFGVLLVVYLFVGLSALVLLFLHSERTLHRPARSRLPAPASADRRWPLAGQRLAFTDSTAGVAGQGRLVRELRGHVVRIGLGTLLVTLLIFFVVPRRGLPAWRGAFASLPSLVGFTEEVRLGELGRIIENPQEVLQVRFFDGPGGPPYSILGEVYLHGTVLTHYDGGVWSHPRSTEGDPPELESTFPARTQGLVWEKITVEPMDRRALFYVRPLVNPRTAPEPSGEAEPKLFFDPARQLLLRPWSQVEQRFAYELGTTGFADGFQSTLIPLSADEAVDSVSLPDSLGADHRAAMPGLVALADQWVRDAGIDPEDRLSCARLLERQLRDSGKYQYSLEGQPRDTTIDPIEDFITNNPRGHCEYFATALVLMLRSQGIPARMVVGFKTDEWNDLGRFLLVRQLHAHTWVEVYLEPRHFRDRAEGDDPRLHGAPGAWLRLDATPGGHAAGVSPLIDMIGKSFGWLDFLWGDYVMDMDRSHQDELVYDPLANWIRAVVKHLRDPDWWRANLANIAAAMGTSLRNLIIAMAVVFVLSVLLIGGQVVRIVLRQRLRRAGQSGRGARSARTMVEFYRRLEGLLARLGLTRLPSQTQREFARQAEVKIAALTGEHDLAGLPGKVVEAFYRVRFGGKPLDKPQAETVEQALTQLTGVLR